MKGYPRWFTRNFIALTFLILFISGLLLAPTAFDLRFQWPVPWRLDGSWRIGVAALHALVSLLAFAILGALWSVHMRLEWRQKRQRMSGVTLVSIFGFLGLTGLGLYYFSSENLIKLSSLVHLALGIALLFIFIWHAFLRRRKNIEPSRARL